jgi:hypothetical protein
MGKRHPFPTNAEGSRWDFALFAEQPQRLRALKLARSLAPTHKVCDASYKADTNHTMGAKGRSGANALRRKLALRRN